MNALKLFMKKNKGKIGKFLGEASDKAKDAGKMGLGAASLGTKKAGKMIEKNPKSAAAIAAAAGVAAGSTVDKKKKKRPYETDED